MATELDLDVIGQIPLDLAVVQGSDAGKPVTVVDPNGHAVSEVAGGGVSIHIALAACR